MRIAPQPEVIRDIRLDCSPQVLHEDEKAGAQRGGKAGAQREGKARGSRRPIGGAVQRSKRSRGCLELTWHGKAPSGGGHGSLLGWGGVGAAKNLVQHVDARRDPVRSLRKGGRAATAVSGGGGGGRDRLRSRSSRLIVDTDSAEAVSARSDTGGGQVGAEKDCWRPGGG